MKRPAILALSLPLLFVALVACGGGERSGSARPASAGQGDLVIAFDTSPTNLDSRVGNDQASGRIFDLVYAGLIKPTTESDYAPDIAERWETPDDRTIIFHLKPGVQFQDGRPLTSRDVKWTYESLMAEDF
jgi:peptide/nickel transport system substrate-binding protein